MKAGIGVGRLRGHRATASRGPGASGGGGEERDGAAPADVPASCPEETRVPAESLEGTR